MSYTRVNWQNSPNTATPLSAENLNKMDAGIKQNADDIEQLQQHTYDEELDGTSTNAPQTKAVYEALQQINVETDTTLSVSGKAADAAATGEAIANVKSAINECLEKPTNRTYVGTITEGYWKQSNGNDFGRLSALYLSASVMPNKTYYATGVSVNTSFALITLFDLNDNVIGTLRGDGNYTPVTDFAFTTPNNCVKVAINGFWNIGTAWSMYPLLYSVDQVASVDGDTIEASLSEKQTKIAHWTKASYIYETGKYALIRRGKVEISTSGGASYSYAKLAYDKAKKYRFYGASRADEILAVVCCDGNDNIIKSYETTLGTVIKGKVYDDIPEATVFIYVNGYMTSTAYIEVEEEAALKSFEGGKVGVCFGDSITQGANVYRWMSTPFEDYPSVVGRMLGCTIYNGGLGGSALSAGRTIDFTNVVDCVVSGDFSTVFEGITEYNLNESATKWYTEISNLNFSSVDFVTIAFGTNDWNFSKTTEQIKTALEYCLQKLITNFPKLRIYVFTPIYRFDINGSGQDADTYVNATTGLKLHQVCEAIAEEAAAFNVPCKDMYYVCNFNQYNKTYYMGDGTHPNANGYAVMGEKVARFINSH